MKKGTFFVLSGPSGSGKGTVLKEVLKKDDTLIFSISATSRAPRKSEINGINYFFKSREEFEKLIKENAFLEYTETYGNYYGTLKEQVNVALEKGKNIILEIDPVGARNIRFSYPEAVLMFLVAPSLEILKNRLTARGSEKENALQTRINSAINEIENASLYDYIVINDFVERASEDIVSIIRAEGLKTVKNLEKLDIIKGGAAL